MALLKFAQTHKGLSMASISAVNSTAAQMSTPHASFQVLSVRHTLAACCTRSPTSQRNLHGLVPFHQFWSRRLRQFLNLHMLLIPLVFFSLDGYIRINKWICGKHLRPWMISARYCQQKCIPLWVCICVCVLCLSDLHIWCSKAWVVLNLLIIYR